MINLSKLHENALYINAGEIKPRNGNTTLDIYKIVAAIQFDQKDYIICLIPAEKHKEHIFALISNIFADENISILSWNKDAGIINVFYDKKKYKILFFTYTNKNNVGFYDGFLVEFS